MPTITLEAGKLNLDQKKQIVKEFTTTASKILDLPEEVFTVYLKENELENIGFGGKLISEGSK